MSRTEIFNKLKEVFAMITGETVENISFKEEDRLLEDVGLNSVGILYLVVGVEEIFGVRFENVGIADFKTVGAVVDYLEAHIA